MIPAGAEDKDSYLTNWDDSGDDVIEPKKVDSHPSPQLQTNLPLHKGNDLTEELADHNPAAWISNRPTSCLVHLNG